MVQPAPIQDPTRGDWAGWLAVALVGGAAPAATNFAIEGAPPVIIAAVRIWIAAALLTAYALATGRPLIAPFGRDGRSVWMFGALAGFCGYALPFVLFPLAQMEVTSITAGIMMSFLPVLTVLFAALFAGEPMTGRSLMGVLMGSLGVLILIGPTVLAGASGTFKGVLLLLGAIFGYASMGVVMRRAPEFPARSFAAIMMIAAALMCTPLMLLTGFDTVTRQGWLSMLFLGIGPTGITAIAIVVVVRRAGAAFLATAAYLAPVVSIALGKVFFDEPLRSYHVIGLLTIMLGIAMTQKSFVLYARRIWPRIVMRAFASGAARSPGSKREKGAPRREG